jgi:bifunctional polynucleotide phosphatase/kinase
LKNEYGLDKIIVSNKSFFCGDAAGRLKPDYYKKLHYKNPKTGDHSDTDRKFALNIGIKFLTPEMLFKGTKEVKYKLSGFNPFDYETSENTDVEFEPRKKELIILVGLPGSGKSTFAKNILKADGYEIVNQDTCKTKAKCKQLTENYLEKGSNIAIDSLNNTKTSRAFYIDLAKQYGYKHIRCIVFNTDLALSKHMNNVRHIYSQGEIARVPDFVYAIYRKNYQEPKKSEGFDLIEHVDYVFNSQLLKDRKFKNAFYSYYED